METSITYYAIFNDGTRSPLHNLESIVAFPLYAFILRVTNIRNGNSFFVSETYEFVNSMGEIQNLKMGDWELVYISKKTFHSTQTSYNLYNHRLQSCLEFKAFKLGLEFVKEELFPNLMELCDIPHYSEHLINKRIDALENKLNTLLTRIESQEKANIDKEITA